MALTIVEEKVVERRYKAACFDPYVVEPLMRVGTEIRTPDGRVFRVMEGIPNNAKLKGITWDEMNFRVRLIYESPDFENIPAELMIPEESVVVTSRLEDASR